MSRERKYCRFKTVLIQIITLDLDPKMIAIALDVFAKNEVTDRVKLLEGPAADTLKTLRGEFDIIFIDADKTGYTNYLKIILERRLLSKNGIIIADNGTIHSFAFIAIANHGVVLSRGLVVDRSDENPYHVQGGTRLEMADAMKEFNDYVANEPRIEVVLLPLFDGLSLIRLKD
jgi:predicted O-methyltransferase YrrM